ncbi:zinc finger BED domain-containing protein RICESLEEPER 2-like [Panicum miliaceum]|uniref:Zinc finger BED domain-containing protein RICESLEEPER 2-like n=1 Tax=Panicum miliaceum TaxID=4540 RepID=A0A3L6TIE8_PANMI|nr:zinc finger BED domain-containing protein RICESLEEPER 2-like [Panicum miliaceum]
MGVEKNRCLPRLLVLSHKERGIIHGEREREREASFRHLILKPRREAASSMERQRGLPSSLRTQPWKQRIDATKGRTEEMPEPEDNMDSVGIGIQFDSQEAQAMVMVPMSVDEQPSFETQEQGKTEGTKKVVIDVDEKETEKTQRKELASRSEMWQYFIKIEDDKGILKAGRCKYCHREIKADKRGHGTSALKKHFGTCKRNPHVFNKDPKQGTLQACRGEAPATWRFDQEALREAFAEMVIEDEQPFCFGEKAGFRKFMSKACPRFQLPSRRTCTRDIVQHYFEEKAKLKKFFKDSCQRVYLTTDCWTSQVQDGYMTVTATFIDENWNLHKKVISFFMVKGHKGEDIGKNLTRCLADWGLDRVMIVTVDNASANDSGVDYLRRQMQKTNIAKGKFLHMRCVAHIVNLIVRDGLQEVDLSIKRVRAAVRYIKNGTSRLVKFKEIAEEEKVDNKAFLKLDVPTRWNSTYLMLKAAIVYEKVFLKLAEDDTNYAIDLSKERDGFGHPDEDDWDNAKKMAQFLQHFHDLTVRISSSLKVTCNTFFHEIGEVHLLIQEWLNNEDNLQVSMGMRMKEKFDKYWGLWHTNSKDNDRQQQEQDRDKGRSKGRGKEKDRENINLLVFVAAFLDPRYKLSLYTKISVEEIFGEERYQLVWAAINTCVRELFEEYRNMYAPPSEETTQVIDANQSKGGAGGMLKEKIAKRMKLSNCSTSTNKSELEKYLAEETEDTEKKWTFLVGGKSIQIGFQF